jgi:hypothetical protein
MNRFEINKERRVFIDRSEVSIIIDYNYIELYADVSDANCQRRRFPVSWKSNRWRGRLSVIKIRLAYYTYANYKTIF